MLGTILIVILILALFGALPRWSHSRDWGYAPTGGLGLILCIVVLLVVSVGFERYTTRQSRQTPQLGGWRLLAVGALARCTVIVAGYFTSRTHDSPVVVPAIPVCEQDYDPLSFAGFFHGLGCGEFPIPVWLGARGAGMQFTDFADRCTTGVTRHG